MPLLLAWSYEGTLRSEEVVKRVATAYGLEAEVTMLADSAVLTVGDRTLAFSRTPAVPPLDQVSEAKALLRDIEDGMVSARAATARLDAIERRPPRFSPAWQVVGLGLFATGFGISVQATGQEIVASAVLGTLVGVLAVYARQRPRLGRMTAGASRLVYSVAILLVLGFGALVATAVVNVPVSFLFDVDVEDTLGFWVVWGGWIIFAAGTMLTFSMRPADFPWALGMILFTAAVAQAGTRGGHPIQGFQGVGDMVALFTALATGMLVAAALVRARA